MKAGTKFAGSAAALVIIAAGAALFLLKDAQELFQPLFEWIDETGAWGRFWFVAIYVLLMIFMIPSFPVTLAGGFLFGFVEGTIYVISAMLIGGAISFLAARRFLSEPIAEKIRRHPRLEGLNEGVGEEGWKIVMLSRLIPFFPAKISNYFFGLTPMRLSRFLIGDLLGLLPWTMTTVYIGSLAATLARLGEHDYGPWQWALYAVGLVAFAGLALSITRIAQRSMEKTIKQNRKP